MVQKLIPLDIVSVVLTLMATGFQCGGYFFKNWWQHKMDTGDSYVSMIDMQICTVSCYKKTLLEFEKDKEWIFATRVFGFFGVIFVVMATVVGLLLVVLRRRVFSTLTVYILATAALFILVGVVVFAAFHDTLNNNLEGKGTVLLPGIGLCSLAAVLCIASSVVAGFALRKHLEEWDDDEE